MGFYNDNKKVAATPAILPNTAGITETNKTNFPKPDEELTKQKFVINTVNNRTGVNTERLATIVEDLKGFGEGSALTVTYYKGNYSETDVKGKQNKEHNTLSRAHQAVLKINNFEIRLTNQLDYQHDAENVLNSISGEGVTYPGFRPEQGDRFIMEVDTGKYALMEVSAPPVRTSIRASTYYKINFSMIEWMSENTQALIDSQVTDEAWFDKTRFLCEPGALLYHDEYVEMKFLTEQHAKLWYYFKAKFFDGTLMYSYMRPDGIYDPYVVDFLLSILNFSSDPYLATQLYEQAPFMDESIWKAILDKNVPLECVPTAIGVKTFYLGSKSVLNTSLINKQYLEWLESLSLADYLDTLKDILFPAEPEQPDEGDGEVPGDGSLPDIAEGTEGEEMTIGDLLLHLHPHYRECPLAADSKFYAGDEGGPLSFILGGSLDHQMLMYKFLTTREIDMDLLHKCIEAVWKLSKLEQFYKMPIYIFLAKLAISYIHYSERIFDRTVG